MTPSPSVWASPGEAQPGAVLDAQHRVVRPHPPQRTLAMGSENVLDRHRALGGLVDQPVMSLHQRPLSVRGAGDGAHRRLAHLPGAQHQTRAQPRVAQPRHPELVPRPRLGVETGADRQRRHVRRGRLEGVAPPRLQRIHIHGLTRFRRRVRAVLATAPAGLTHANPVRRPHTRPRLFGLVDERLQQPGAIAVEPLAVAADRPGGPAQHVGGPSCGTRHRGAPAAGTGPAPDAGGLRRPVSSQPIQASRTRRRRALAANPTPPSQPCAEPTR